jgi:polysaccharide export outer membrane protein
MRPPAIPWVPPPGGELPPNVPAPRNVSLIPGDLLDIRVYGQSDLDLEVRIPRSGTINYPLVGSLKASGRSTAEFEKELADKLRGDYIKDPHVTVTVKEYAERKVYILGGIKAPGVYPLSPTERITLLQLVSTSGGYTDRAYKEYTQIIRRTGKGERKVIRLSLVKVEQAVAKGEAGADLELWPDDLVVIPSAARVVYVLGAVKSPGSFALSADTRMTVSMAVSRAGSYTKFASTSRIQVLRQTPEGKAKKIQVNLDRVVNGELEFDIELKPGDVVWVPERGLF